MAKTKRLAPGIYFGLDEVTYHTDPALGSTDIRRLRRSGPDYWLHSWMNPKRPPVDDLKPTPARLFGKAMHKFVLEGRQAFEGRYVRRPDDEDGASSSEKAAVTKAANASAAKEGKDCLHGDSYDRIVMAGAMIALNPELATAFEGGASEVSVFWDHPDIKGLRLKCRFDKMKRRGIGDLKSIANEREEDFEVACRSSIARYRYDIQAQHYLTGRAQLPALVKAGAVFNSEGVPLYDAPEATHGDVDLLKLVEQAAAEPAFAFQFVFFQSGDAPITWSTTMTPGRTEGDETIPGNPMLQYAQGHIDQALERWQAFMTEFGTESMWIFREPVKELDVESMPAWYGR